MIERVVNLLTLFTDEGLYEAQIVIDADHGRYIALKFRHLAGCPAREVAESHFVALADDVVEFVEHLEIDVVNLLHLLFQPLGMHHRVQQHLIGTFQCGQHVESLHQVGHTYVVMSLGLLLAGFQQLFVQQPVGVASVEDDVVDVRTVGHRTGMNPDGVLAALKPAT